MNHRRPGHDRPAIMVPRVRGGLECIRRYPYRVGKDASSGGRAPARSLEHKEVTLSSEILDKFSELITTALGLVAAQAWNAAI
jgi:Family of unknown function (DUF5654)